MQTLEVFIHQKNAWRTEKNAASGERKTSSKIYAEAPMESADARHRDTDPDMKHSRMFQNFNSISSSIITKLETSSRQKKKILI